MNTNDSNNKLLRGEIKVAEVVRDAQRLQQCRREWQARMRRNDLRREEAAVLRLWWRTDEKDRPEVVQRHREVFTRIKANRQRANRIEQEERAIQDAAMRKAGYIVRPGRVWPRYVRPGWKGGDEQ